MDPLTRWEAEAITRRGGRPRPGTGGPSIIDLRGLRAPASPAPPSPDPPPDTLLVPLDAWNRMLNQLGNLHEAGRDLAEARERAARAETEAEFLRERVADLRERLAVADTEVVPTSAPEPRRQGPGRRRPFEAVRSVYARWRVRHGRGS